MSGSEARFSPKLSAIVHARPAYMKALLLSPLPVCRRLSRIIACTLSMRLSVRE